ncbi:MAG: hypothetical protein RBU29_11585 [bacterium]|jgi:hypothetical protein|nr:hypothetical protein [bacterium]
MTKRRCFLIFLLTLCLSSLAPFTTAEEPLCISGIYPHLAMFNERFKEDGAGETGVGAVVPWAGKLWVLTYSAHKPGGSADRLYAIDDDLHMEIRPESIGGTPANRLIHRESNQLFMGPYAIDAEGKVRAIPYSSLFGRPTATFRHLSDPANKVYFFTMEEGLYEVDVHSLAVTTLYEDRNKKDIPDLIPGYHGKGGYTGQGRIVVANNGEQGAGQAGYVGPSGSLAQWDGREWTVIQRHPFCEVTGPGGLYGNANPTDPIWATGWDEKSILLMLLDEGQWHTFRLPKASNTYDAKHGWYTEWPRIRSIHDNHWLMTMHGMFWDFPNTFRHGHTAGIRPLSSYLKIVADFCSWNGKLVFGCDDTSLFGNPIAGQPQSNLWFVDPDELSQFGPASAYGGVWEKENLQAGSVSDPFCIAGFSQRTLHLGHRGDTAVDFSIEIDPVGTNQWEQWQTVRVPAQGYAFLPLPIDLQAEWVRLTVRQDCTQALGHFYLAKTDPRPLLPDPALFQRLAKADATQVQFGLIRPRGDADKTLQFNAMTAHPDGSVTAAGYYEIGAAMKLEKKDDPAAAQYLEAHAPIYKADFTQDTASVIVTNYDGQRYRLPKGGPAFQSPGPLGQPRGIREVATERNLFNCQGTFYELPRPESGGFAKMKPISTHQRLIQDFCSWRGLLVLSGTSPAEADGHYIPSEDGKTGLWFGTIDDLWQLGKPSGQGGPWAQTPVQAGKPSDPYLMTGYDNKQLHLSHNQDLPVSFTIEVDVTGNGEWFSYKSMTVQPGQIFHYTFPRNYGARWVRLIASTDCQATATFIYN